MTERLERQRRIMQWVRDTFGHDNGRAGERAARLLEEAIEFYQAVGGSKVGALDLVAYVFSKPPGEPTQELGGVGVCVLAAAESIGVSADEAERIEFARVLAIDPARFRERHNRKADAGIATRVETHAAQARRTRERALHEHVPPSWLTSPAATALGDVSVPPSLVGISASAHVSVYSRCGHHRAGRALRAGASQPEAAEGTMKPADVIRQAYDELRAATGFVHGAGTWLEEARRYFEREERAYRRDPRCSHRKYKLSVSVTAKWLVLIWVYGSSRVTCASDVINWSRGKLCARAVFEVLELYGKLPPKDGAIAESLWFRYDEDVLLGGY